MFLKKKDTTDKWIWILKKKGLNSASALLWRSSALMFKTNNQQELQTQIHGN